MDFLFLDSPKSPHKSRRFLQALYRDARKTAKCELTTQYRDCKALVIYGLGGPDRFLPGMSHLEKGKPLLSFDIGYWDRGLPNRKYRFSLNGLHPTQVMDGEYPGDARWRKSGLSIESIRFNGKGPVMLVGNAPKSIVIGAKNWTAEKSKEIRKAFPDKQILYRPKPKRPHEPGVIYDALSTGPIDNELRGVSLVVCRHSNVAVDACRLGVPVVCDSGAAACIYPESLTDWQAQPDMAARTEFLHRLAYWQWGVNEVELFWLWFFRTFPSYDYRQLS